jgi:quinol monooxygenase YgiN
MKNVGILAILEARPGKERDLSELLRGALAVAETGTVTWYAFQSGPQSFYIFDTFADDAGRTAHLQGPIAKALLGRADELLAKAPDMHKVDVLAAT